MTTQIYKSTERGTADFGWLKANFSFSFGNYFNPKKVQFGMLRVLNDDTIAAGMGFGTHPHENMEIITIPLEGGLKHRDSMGNEGLIGFGEVQVMSAGTGIELHENAFHVEAHGPFGHSHNTSDFPIGFSLLHPQQHRRFARRKTFHAIE